VARRRLKSRFFVIPENEKGSGGKLMTGGKDPKREYMERKVVLGYGSYGAQRSANLNRPI
jgi:hypothetical protein